MSAVGFHSSLPRRNDDHNHEPFVCFVHLVSSHSPLLCLPLTFPSFVLPSSAPPLQDLPPHLQAEYDMFVEAVEIRKRKLEDRRTEAESYIEDEAKARLAELTRRTEESKVCVCVCVCVKE